MKKIWNNNNNTNHNRLAGVFLIVGWVIFLILGSVLINNAFYKEKPPTLAQTHGGLEITLHRGRDAHFRIPGTINGVKVEFMIDTGATTTAVSSAIADKAGLITKGAITTETAAGDSRAYLSTIDTLVIEGIEMQDVGAVIVPEMGGSTQALLGMNVLSKFEMRQSSDEMVLRIPNVQSN